MAAYTFGLAASGIAFLYLLSIGIVDVFAANFHAFLVSRHGVAVQNIAPRCRQADEELNEDDQMIIRFDKEAVDHRNNYSARIGSWLLLACG